jgi:3-oxoacyl-[acyl-carrier protein] reductase
VSKYVAFITGGSRGIGNAIVARLRDEGIDVLAPTRESLDLLNDQSIYSYIAGLSHPIDILINNAGINILGNGDEFRDDDLDMTLQVNLIAPMKLARAFIPGMKKRKFGRIINISSIWSFVSRPRRVVYSVTKAGLNGFTRSLATELAPYNVLVNAVAPGYVNTELTRKNNSPAEIDAISEMIPIKRMAEPYEIAELVYFLASEKNSYITGQVITIDGGFTCL